MNEIGPSGTLEELIRRMTLLFPHTSEDGGTRRFEGASGLNASIALDPQGQYTLRLEAEDGSKGLEKRVSEGSPLRLLERWMYEHLTGSGQAIPTTSDAEAIEIIGYLDSELRRFTLNGLWGDLNWIEEHVRSALKAETESTESLDELNYSLGSLKRARRAVQTLSRMLGVPFNVSDQWDPFGRGLDE